MRAPKAADPARTCESPHAMSLIQGKSEPPVMTSGPPQRDAGCLVRDLGALLARGLKYGAIMADPPWRYARNPRGGAARHYRTMSLADIAALPVRGLAAPQAHLHLWTTHSFLFEARQVMEAWGFEYKSVFVWVKPGLGTGYYWRSACEFMLLGIRGACPFRSRSIRNWICIDRGEHGEKPEQVRERVERVSPPPYLELFGRRAVGNWAVFGNEISTGLFDQNVVRLD